MARPRAGGELTLTTSEGRWRGQRSWRGRGPLIEHALMGRHGYDRWTGTGMGTRQLSQSVRRVQCPRMRGGGPCREGGTYRVCWSGPEDGDVPELRLLAPQQAQCPTAVGGETGTMYSRSCMYEECPWYLQRVCIVPTSTGRRSVRRCRPARAVGRSSVGVWIVRGAACGYQP